MFKVLVVEDEEMIRTGIVLAVDWASLDCTVVAQASNGLEGLEAARQYAPDLIITDLKMPQMDGLEMVRRLREEGCAASVIILTAYDTFSFAQSALRLGAVDYLLKPFHDGDLEKAVARLHPVHSPSQLLGLDDMRRGATSRYVLATMDYIGKNFAQPDISVGTAAASLGISEGHLSHLFKKETGHTVLGYLTRCRISRAMELLKDCRFRVYEVAEQVGYRDIAYFSNTFKRLTGMTPSEYQLRE